MSAPRLVFLIAAFALVSAGQPTSAGGHPCFVAPAAGLWELPPPGSAATGAIEGSVGRFRLAGVLRDVPSPCLSCYFGSVTAILDDGIGAGPDYVVSGHYVGGLVIGPGEFSLQVTRPGSSVPVGEIRGRYLDVLFVPGPGTFGGRARICP
jgi:hypothetical protein